MPAVTPLAGSRRQGVLGADCMTASSLLAQWGGTLLSVPGRGCQFAHCSALGGAQPCRRSARPGEPLDPAELTLDVEASSEQGDDPAAPRVHRHASKITDKRMVHQKTLDEDHRHENGAPVSHLGCIGNPSKITDTPDGAPENPRRRSPTREWCTSERGSGRVQLHTGEHRGVVPRRCHSRNVAGIVLPHVGLQRLAWEHHTGEAVAVTALCHVAVEQYVGQCLNLNVMPYVHRPCRIGRGKPAAEANSGSECRGLRSPVLC